MQYYNFHNEGGIGNVMIALMNAILLSIYTNIPVYIRKCPYIGMFNDLSGLFFDPQTFTLQKTDLNLDDPEKHQPIYLGIPETYYAPRIIPREKDKRMLMRSLLSPSVLPQVETPLEEDHLVIHIRSGDIFNGLIHHSYIQPPLSYYEYILENNAYNRVTIVTESDMMNPVIKELINRHPDLISVSSSNLEEDVRFILSAKHLVVGTGSFAHILSLASPCIQKVYCFTAHNIYYPECKEQGYEIRVFGVENDDYPRAWTGDTSCLMHPWTIVEKDMTDFVEQPKCPWDS